MSGSLNAPRVANGASGAFACRMAYTRPYHGKMSVVVRHMCANAGAHSHGGPSLSSERPQLHSE